MSKMQDIADLFKSGMKPSQIANRLNIGNDYVSKSLRKYGIPPQINSGNFLSKKQSPRREEAREMKQQGMTYQQIADQMHISRQRAQQLVRETEAVRKKQIKENGGICESCGKMAKKLDIHHDDYDGAPTRVLCVSCHKSADAQLGLTRHRTLRPVAAA